jgi:excinuclease ABC subunit C
VLYLEQLVENPVDGVYVAEKGDSISLNLHVGQINAGSHSKNLRGGETTSPYTDTVKLFQRIRDESHRFAISYHTTLKRSAQTKSKLDEIPGVGDATRKKLVRAFGSGRGVATASLADLQMVLGRKTGEKVYEFLQNDSAV